MRPTGTCRPSVGGYTSAYFAPGRRTDERKLIGISEQDDCGGSNPTDETADRIIIESFHIERRNRNRFTIGSGSLERNAVSAGVCGHTCATCTGGGIADAATHRPGETGPTCYPCNDRRSTEPLKSPA